MVVANRVLLRWLITVSRIFQNVIIKATRPSFTVDVIIMISNKCPIVDKQVKVFFVMQKVAVTTI